VTGETAKTLMASHDMDANTGVYAVPFMATHAGSHGQHVRGTDKSYTLSTVKEDACVAVAYAGQARVIRRLDVPARTLVHGGHSPENSTGLYAVGGSERERIYAGSSARRALAAGEMRARRLTPLEAERVQGFPDGWTDVKGVPETARYRLVGNSVMPPVVEFLGRMLA